MKTRLLYLLPLALLLWGCPTKNEEEPEPEKTCLLQRLQNDIGGNTFSYNSQNQLTTVAYDSAGVPGGSAVLTYDAKNRLISVDRPRERLTNAYNEAGQLIRQTRSYLQAGTYKEMDYYTFSYNSKNELTEARYYYSGQGTAQLYYIYKFTNQNGDPTSIEIVSAQEERVSLLELSYDGKPSPLPALPYIFFQPEQSPAAHNLTSYRETDRHGNLFRSYQLAYTYNQNGLPAAATITLSSGDKWTRTYSYVCQ